MKLEATTPVPRSTAVTNEILHSDWAAQVRIDGKPLTQLLDEQVRFAFVGSGPLATRRIEAETAAARAVLAGPNGERVQQILRGWLSLAPTGTHPDVTGVAFSTSLPGLTANFLVSDALRSRGIPLHDPTDRSPEDIRRRFQALADAYRHGFGVYEGLALEEPYIVASTIASDGILKYAVQGDALSDPEDRAQAWWSAYALSHELLHRVTPYVGTWTWKPSVQYPGKVQVLEEAATELCSRLPSNINRISRSFGIPENRKYVGSYDLQVDVLSALVTRAGLDPTGVTTERAVFDLLQHGTASRLDQRLADAIVSAHGLPDGDRSRMRRLVTDIFRAPGPIDFDWTQSQTDAWSAYFRSNADAQLAAIDAMVAGR